MDRWKIITLIASGLMLGTVLVWAVPREINKLYLIVQKSDQHVLQMGISPESVKVTDSDTEALVIIDGEKPAHLSETYFKIVDGELVDMTISERAQVDAQEQTELEDEEVARLKAIMARDPVGFRAVLGL